MKEHDDNALYMLLGEMRGDLKSIIGSLGTMRTDHRRLREDFEKTETRHDDRINTLERQHWKLAGIAMVIPFVVTAVGWFARGLF
jgi:hypothetical protein